MGQINFHSRFTAVANEERDWTKKPAGESRFATNRASRRRKRLPEENINNNHVAPANGSSSANNSSRGYAGGGSNMSSFQYYNRREEAWNQSVKTFDEIYEVGEQLGSGSFSVVYSCRHRMTRVAYAVKCVDYEHLEADDRNALEREIRVMNEIAHPNIVQLVEVFKEKTVYYIVMELIRGGELFDRIVQRTCFPELVARDLLRLLLTTINYLHYHTIIHRDIKPENLLMIGEDDTQIKVVDFGFAEYVSDVDQCHAACGTPQYVAPEILQGRKYGTMVDIWSTGVVAYVLMGGYPPFYDQEKKKLFCKIVKGQLTFHSPFWDDISDDAKDFIRKMLIVDPNKRYTAAMLLEHRWVKGIPPMTRQWRMVFSGYHARRRFRATVLVVIAVHRLRRTPLSAWVAGADRLETPAVHSTSTVAWPAAQPLAITASSHANMTGSLGNGACDASGSNDGHVRMINASIPRPTTMDREGQNNFMQMPVRFENVPRLPDLDWGRSALRLHARGMSERIDEETFSDVAEDVDGDEDVKDDGQQRFDQLDDEFPLYR